MNNDIILIVLFCSDAHFVVDVDQNLPSCPKYNCSFPKDEKEIIGGNKARWEILVFCLLYYECVVM